LVIHYQSMLRHDGERTRSSSSLRKGQPPTVEDNVLKWHSSALQIDGTWRSLSRPLQETVLESDAGSIHWHCLQPRAFASVRVGKTAAISGFGYVENVRMSIPPWRLPLQQLRWGRFLSETDELVWIDWCGPYSKQVVFYNGESVLATGITDHAVALAASATTLSLDRGRVLREGTIVHTALAKLPGLEKILPRQILAVRECKWLSRAVLRRAGAAEAAGWAIHEVVQWP
jgi:hypothetical protein